MHPDSRAQLFEADKYNKRKIRDLLIVLDGLGIAFIFFLYYSVLISEDVQRLMRLFEGIKLNINTK